MRWVFLIIVAIFFSGCEIDRQKGVLMQERNSAQKAQKADDEATVQEDINTFELRHNAAVELEKLKAEHTLALKKLELEASQKELEVRQELAQKEQETALVVHKQKLEFYKIALIVFAVVALFALLIFYLIAKKNRQTKQKMQEDKLKAEYELKQQEFYHQRVNKLLEIAASKESDESIKKDALNMIKNDHTFRRLDFKDD